MGKSVLPPQHALLKAIPINTTVMGKRHHLLTTAALLVLLVLLSSCATQIIIPEPMPVPYANIKTLTPYSETAPALPSTWPVLATTKPRSMGSSKASLFNAGNRFIDWSDRDRFLGKVQPLLGSRCVSCHGCTDSPCRLKLTSYENIIKGASSINYYALRISEARDPKTKPGAKDFHAVAEKTKNGKDRDSILYRLVLQGMHNTVDSDPEGGFDLAAVQKQQLDYDATADYQCPASLSKLNSYQKQFPAGGMPFGLPRLQGHEVNTLYRWVEDGVPGPQQENYSDLYLPSKPEAIQRWEQWLNQDSNKARLMARYLYQHVFSAHIHFEEMPGEFYQLVRAKNPPGDFDNDDPSGIDIITTSLPTDAPNRGRVFYRLRKITDTVARKAHIVWHVNDATLKALDDLFMQTAWEVTDEDIKLPSYDNTNPFTVFAQIPAVLRHRFLLENSKLIVEAMIRSPVCVGRSATYAIADHFWVFFLKPESDVSSGAPFYRLGLKAMQALDLDTQSITLISQHIDRFDNNRTFRNGYEVALRKDLETQAHYGLRPAAGLGLGDIWDGGGNNPNAWLTVVRHDASTTVHQGQEGGLPQSIWVLSYANFERLYYNLVVNFKYWGGLYHKLGTWQSMNHERLDGEDLFLSFLPEDARAAIREEYSGGVKLPAQVVTGYIGRLVSETKIERPIDLYPLNSTGRPALTPLSGTGRADHKFARLIQQRMSSTVRVSDDILNSRLSDNQNIYIGRKQGKVRIPRIRNLDQWELMMRKITQDRGKNRYVPYLPSTTYLRVGTNGEYRLYSLISNRGYLSHNSIFMKEQERDPKRDTLSIFRGAVGDYPELFLDVPLNKAGDFLRRVQALNQQNHKAGLRSLKRDYGIRRNSSKFWPFVDWLHSTLAESEGGYIYEGIVDLSKYDLYDRN